MEFITGRIPSATDAQSGALCAYLRGLRAEINHALESVAVRSGECDGWRWRAYSDGTAECWRQVVCENVTCSVPWGTLFESVDGYGGIEYPFEFADRPHQMLSVSQTIDSAYMLEYPFGTYSNTKTDTGRWWFVRPSMSEGGRATVDVYVRGRVRR